MTHEIVELQILQEKQNEMQKKEFMTPIQLRLIELLDRKGPMHRNEICKAFGFKQYAYERIIKHTRIGKNITYYKQSGFQYENRTTIYDNLVKLIKRKIVKKFSQNKGNRGRPFIYFELIT